MRSTTNRIENDFIAYFKSICDNNLEAYKESIDRIITDYKDTIEVIDTHDVTSFIEGKILSRLKTEYDKLIRKFNAWIYINDKEREHQINRMYIQLSTLTENVKNSNIEPKYRSDLLLLVLEKLVQKFNVNKESVEFAIRNQQLDLSKITCLDKSIEGTVTVKEAAYYFFYNLVIPGHLDEGSFYIFIEYAFVNGDKIGSLLTIDRRDVRKQEFINIFYVFKELIVKSKKAKKYVEILTNHFENYTFENVYSNFSKSYIKSRKVVTKLELLYDKIFKIEPNSLDIVDFTNFIQVNS
jgi:hypothetical protein